MPGIIEDPGCKAGRFISKIPLRGPDARKIKSLLILDNVTPKLFKAEEYITNPCMLEVAAIRSALKTIGLPVILAR
ncbi:hypothetical protein D3C80_1074490 [compost metagenome]